MSRAGLITARRWCTGTCRRTAWDLEQREERVHRFEGRAILKNVAARHGDAAFNRRVVNRWEAMFGEASTQVTNKELRDIEPFWVYEGDVDIERQVPRVPLTREVDQLRRLWASLAAYPLVLGRPRQEGLVAYLGDRMPPDELAKLAEKLRIDLTPKKHYRQAAPSLAKTDVLRQLPFGAPRECHRVVEDGAHTT